MEAAVAEADGNKSKKAKVEKDAKQNFVHLLKTEGKKVVTAGATAEGKTAKMGAKWGVLSDDFGMASNKMKDWDKSDSEEEQETRFDDDEDDDEEWRGWSLVFFF